MSENVIMLLYFKKEKFIVRKLLKPYIISFVMILKIRLDPSNN